MRKVLLFGRGGETLLCERFESEWGVDVRVKGKLFIIVPFYLISLWNAAVCTRRRRKTQNDNDGQRHARVGMQQFDREPQYAEANPGEIVIMPCRVFNKKGQCVWQKDGKVCILILIPTKVITFFFSFHQHSRFQNFVSLVLEFFVSCLVLGSNLFVRFGFEWIARRNLPWEIRMG